MWMELNIPHANVGRSLAGHCFLALLYWSPKIGVGCLILPTCSTGNRWHSVKGTTTNLPLPLHPQAWWEREAPLMSIMSPGKIPMWIPRCGNNSHPSQKSPKGRMLSKPRWEDRSSLWSSSAFWLAWTAILDQCDVWMPIKPPGRWLLSWMIASFSFSSCISWPHHSQFIPRPCWKHEIPAPAQ